jgi:hydrogenase-4 component B
VTLVLVALGLLLASGLAALALGRSDRDPSWLAAGGVLAGAVVGCVPALGVLLGGAPASLRVPWQVPYGEFFIELDALSAWFLIPIFGLSALAAIYGTEYLAPWRGRRSLGPTWFFYNVLVASMVLVVLARNAVLFLVAWEVMALASFFLVTFEDEKEEVRSAGWVYLVATHLGTAFLLAFFLVAARETGSTDFNQWAARGIPPTSGSLLFVLAVFGFGAKAGFMPFHVWLPEAHPAAPSHVSALMSGVMIKTGIYGLLRALTFLGPPQAWWGWTLIGIGLTSGILGILFALAQHDLKRLLAYSSVENIGIIALGMGLGTLGLSAQNPALVALGFGGALLHALNHSLFKGLLFLGAGSVLHAAGTRDIDRLGGLLKRMPWTGGLFLLGAVAICGLPPLNGFVGEWLLFSVAFGGIISSDSNLAIAGLMALAGLALIGGMAATAFTKAFGIVFLGEPRQTLPHAPHEAGWTMRVPMILLAVGCFAVTIGASWIVRSLTPVLGILTKAPTADLTSALQGPANVLTVLSLLSIALIALVALLAFVRRMLLSGRAVTTAVTWDCGYARPAARMQYTGSSFVQPFADLFRAVLRSRVTVAKPEGILPARASLSTATPDLCHGELYRPAFMKVNWGLSKLRWLQHGKVQLYVLYIALTLLALLFWKLR